MNVWTLTYSHRHGIDVLVYASEKSAKDGIDAIVRENWAGEFRGEELPEESAEETLVDQYFRHKLGDEWYEIERAEVLP